MSRLLLVALCLAEEARGSPRVTPSRLGFSVLYGLLQEAACENGHHYRLLGRQHSEPTSFGPENALTLHPRKTLLNHLGKEKSNTAQL